MADSRRIRELRRVLAARQRGRCHYCGRKMTPAAASSAERRRSSLTLDHVVPRSRGGATSWRNCVAACWGCNVAKGDRPAPVVGLAAV